MKTPKGGDRRPTFHSRRFCRSVCRRMKALRRSRNAKGKFEGVSYGGFSAGSLRVLGTFSAESRQDLGEISHPLAMRCLGGPKTAPREPKGSQRVPKGAKREPKGSQRKPKGRPKGAQGEAKSIKNQGFSWHGFLEASGQTLGTHFGSIWAPYWEPNSLFFRVIFRLRFLIYF